MNGRVKGLFSGDGLRARAVRGILSTGGVTIAEQVFRFASNLILTRLLFPEAFGLMAIITVILVGLQMVSTFGLQASVMQNPRGDEEDFLNTAWTLQVIRGVVVWLVASLFAPVFAQMYDQPILAQLLPVAGLSVLLTGFFTTRVLSAQRHLKLVRYSLLTIAAQVVGLLAMAFLAWQLQSVWALAIGTLVQPAVALLLYARFMEGARNRFHLDRGCVREIFKLGKYLFLSTIATYAVMHGDRAILGFYIPVDLLGIYGLALALATLPNHLATKIAAFVVFPLYRMHHPSESASNQRNIFRTRRLLAIGSITMLSTLAFLGPWFVDVLYDARYQLAGPITVLLSAAYIPMVVLNGTMNAALSKGDSLRFMIYNVATAAAQTAVMFWGVQSFGVVGAAMAILTAPLLTYPLLAYFLRRYGNWDILGDIALIAAGLAVTGSAVWLHLDKVLLLMP